MKLYCYKQHDITDCGPACLATISRQYGLNIPISKIRTIAGTDRQGTNVAGMIRAAEKLGFSAKGVKGDEEAFFMEFPLPCVAHVIVNQTLMHYVVIHRITRKKITIADPAKGIVTLSPREFFGGTRKNEDDVVYRWTGVLIFLVPGQNFHKGSQKEKIGRQIWMLMKPQKRLLWYIVMASFAYSVFGIGGAYYFKILFHDIIPDLSYETLYFVASGMLCLYLFYCVMGAIRSQMLLYLSQKLDISLLLGYYSHVLRLPMDFFGTRRMGEIISRFQDASKVREAISSAAMTILIDSIMAAGGFALLVVQNRKMAFMTGWMIVLYAGIVYAFRGKYRRLNEKQMEDNALLTSYMVETLNGIQTIKAFGGEQKVDMQTEFRFVSLLKRVFQLGVAGNIQETLKMAVQLLGTNGILSAGAYFVMKGEMEAGNLLVFYSLLSYFLKPVMNLLNLQQKLQTAVVAMERLQEVMALPEEEVEEEEYRIIPRKLEGDVVFDHVSFRYGSRALCLDDICLTLHRGEKLALVGESGSGKTTLVKLLLQFYPPETGNILINDNNVEDIQKEALRNRIGYVPQETHLFSGNIIENLTLGLEQYSVEEVIRVCKQVHAHEFINELPARYETKLEENGSNLSGGQRQRLAIARALLKKPDILILDEATSSLDSMTEQAVQKAIDEASQNMTCIIIAHRLSTILRCDHICVMDHGKIVEYGTHQQLIRAKGKYFLMWKQQTGLAEENFAEA